MTFHKRMTAGLVACCFAAASVGCTSMKTIHPKTIHPYSDPAAPTFGRLKAGDTVVLQTRDGRRERFVVQKGRYYAHRLAIGQAIHARSD